MRIMVGTMSQKERLWIGHSPETVWAMSTPTKSKVVPSRISVCTVINGKDLVSSRCVTFSHSFPSALARFKLPLPYPFARINMGRLGTSLDLVKR